MCASTIYTAASKKRISRRKINGQFYYTKHDLDNYRLSRNSQLNRMYKGEKLFDIDKGLFSVSIVLQCIRHVLKREISRKRIYEYLRNNEHTSFKKGREYVITRDDAEKMLDREIEYYENLPIQVNFPFLKEEA